MEGERIDRWREGGREGGREREKLGSLDHWQKLISQFFLLAEKLTQIPEQRDQRGGVCAIFLTFSLVGSVPGIKHPSSRNSGLGPES